MSPQPGAAGRRDVPDVDLLQDQLVPLVRRVQRTQRVLVGRPGRGRVAQLVTGPAQGERGQAERGVIVQSPAQCPRRTGRVVLFQQDEPEDEVRLRVVRGAGQQPGHLGQSLEPVASVGGFQCRGEPLPPAERPPPGY